MDHHLYDRCASSHFDLSGTGVDRKDAVEGTVKVQVDSEMLKFLRDHAIQSQTLPQWSEIAVEFICACDSEIISLRKQLATAEAEVDRVNKRWCETVPGYFVCRACKQVCVKAVGEYDGMCEECFDKEEDE